MGLVIGLLLQRGSLVGAYLAVQFHKGLLKPPSRFWRKEALAVVALFLLTGLFFTRQSLLLSDTVGKPRGTKSTGDVCFIRK